MNKLSVVFVAVAMAAAGGLAIAQSQLDEGEAAAMDHGTASHGGHDAQGAAASDNPAVQGYMAANDRMHADMAIEFTGDADVDFMRGMIPHHQGAIDMAKVVLQHGKDEQTKKLAADVIREQEREIAEMREWLKKRGL